MARVLGLLLCICAVVYYADASTFQQINPRTLVLIDDHNTRNTHSDFFAMLINNGHRVTIAHLHEDVVSLQNYGERTYENLIIFAPTAPDLGEFIKVHDVVDFVNAGNSLLMAASSSLSEPLRQIAKEFNVEFMESGSDVMDHSRYNVLETTQVGPHAGRHVNVLADNYNQKLTSFLSKSTFASLNKPETPTAGVLFEGIGLFKMDATITQAPVLYGNPASTFSMDPMDKKAAVVFGNDVVLVAAVQTPNNARAVFAGSMEMFSNKSFSTLVQLPRDNSSLKRKTANKSFCMDMSKWVFHEKGFLKVTSYSHRLLNSGGGKYHPFEMTATGPKGYRVKDHIEFSMTVQEWNGDTQQWIPYAASDVQLEFVMIDPYIRTDFPMTKTPGNYNVRIQVPDNMGIFKFVVGYHKLGEKGVSNLDWSQAVSVRPFRHDEHDRFLWVASPYYLAAASIMAAFVLFSGLFLYSK